MKWSQEAKRANTRYPSAGSDGRIERGVTFARKKIRFLFRREIYGRCCEKVPGVIRIRMSFRWRDRSEFEKWRRGTVINFVKSWKCQFRLLSPWSAMQNLNFWSFRNWFLGTSSRAYDCRPVDYLAVKVRGQSDSAAQSDLKVRCSKISNLQIRWMIIFKWTFRKFWLKLCRSFKKFGKFEMINLMRRGAKFKFWNFHGK